MNAKIYQKCKTDFCFNVVYGRSFQTNIGRFKSKRDNLDALVCIMSSPEVTS